jgi:hypothetical protein
MIRTLIAATTALIVSAAALTPAHADNFVVGLPKDYADKKGLETVVSAVFMGIRPGNTLNIFNATERQRLAQISLPKEEAQANPRLRLKLFGGQLAPVGAHLTAAATAAATTPRSNIDMPQFLRELGDTVLPALPGKTAEVLLVGSARFHDPRELRFTMTGGFFPNDGHFKVDNTASPFGTANRRDTLKGVRVHLCITDTDWIDDTHRVRVQRFWSLYLEQLGGQLASFTNDLALCTQRLLAKNADGGERYAIDARQTKPEMLRINRNSTRTSEAPAQAPAQTQEFGTGAVFLDQGIPLTTTPPVTLTGRVKVGIRWDCRDCDLDLYARATPTASYLFWNNQVSPEGRHNKDHRSSPDFENQHEYIEFPRPIDLGNLDVYLHFYEGRSPRGARGTLRIWFEGKVYEQAFLIPAAVGTPRGSPRPDLMRGPEWVKVDVRQVLGLSARVRG